MRKADIHGLMGDQTPDGGGMAILCPLRRPALVALCGFLGVVLVFTSYRFGAAAVIAAAMVVVLVVLAAMDLEQQPMANTIVFPAAAAILAARVAFFPTRWLEFVLAPLVAAAAFLIPNAISGDLFGPSDAKLALILGAGLGWGVIGAVCVALVASFPFAVATLVRGGLIARTATLPFAPFLAFGALAVMIVPRLVGFTGA